MRRAAASETASEATSEAASSASVVAIAGGTAGSAAGDRHGSKCCQPGASAERSERRAGQMIGAERAEARVAASGTSETLQQRNRYGDMRGGKNGCKRGKQGIRRGKKNESTDSIAMARATSAAT